MDKQNQVACGSCCQRENPQLHTVVELPAVDLFDVVLGQLIPDVAQVETQLANVLETELIALGSVERK